MEDTRCFLSDSGVYRVKIFCLYIYIFCDPSLITGENCCVIGGVYDTLSLRLQLTMTNHYFHYAVTTHVIQNMPTAITIAL